MYVFYIHVQQPLIVHPSTESGSSFSLSVLSLDCFHIFNPCNSLLSTSYSPSYSKVSFLEGTMLTRTLLIKTSYPCMQQIQTMNEDLECTGNWEKPLGVFSHCNAHNSWMAFLFLFCSTLCFFDLSITSIFLERSTCSIVMTTCGSALGALRSW